MKYALIGCGRIATNHIKAAVNNQLEIVAVCDIIPECMESVLDKHGLREKESIKRYTDYKLMITEQKPELVSIATESGLHGEIAIYCIEQGIHVIIEKGTINTLKMRPKNNFPNPMPPFSSRK